MTLVLHDATVVADSGIGELTAIHGFNSVIPYVQKHVKGPKRHLPPLPYLTFSLCFFWSLQKDSFVK